MVPYDIPGPHSCGWPGATPMTKSNGCRVPIVKSQKAWNKLGIIGSYIVTVLRRSSFGPRPPADVESLGCRSYTAGSCASMCIYSDNTKAIARSCVVERLPSHNRTLLRSNQVRVLRRVATVRRAVQQLQGSKVRNVAERKGWAGCRGARGSHELTLT